MMVLHDSFKLAQNLRLHRHGAIHMAAGTADMLPQRAVDAFGIAHVGKQDLHNTALITRPTYPRAFSHNARPAQKFRSAALHFCRSTSNCDFKAATASLSRMMRFASRFTRRDR